MYQGAITEFSRCAAAGDVCSRQLGIVYALLDRRAEAMKVLDQFKEQYSKQPIEAYNLWLRRHHCGTSRSSTAIRYSVIRIRNFYPRFLLGCR